MTTPESEKQAIEPQETVLQVPLSELHPFEGHPFKVRDDEEMQKMVESLTEFGIMVPLIVRPDPEGGYEILSGHRRHRASELAGKETIPVIVRNLDDDAAIILMCDSNLHREHILPSERAWAYKMKLEALKHQGKATSRQVGEKSTWAVAQVGKDADESERQVHRYVRLTNLCPELMDMVDEKKIAFSPAVELSYLKPEEQQGFLEAMDYSQNTPSLSQAQRIKKMSQSGICTQDTMNGIMSEAKKSELDSITLKNDVLRKYFPRSYTPKQMEDTIIRLLEQWQKRRQRENSR